TLFRAHKVASRQAPMAIRVVVLEAAAAGVSVLALDLPSTSRTTPAKPINKPRARDVSGLSLSHNQATAAPESGAVAFRMADRLVVMCKTAYEYNANGRAELSRPTKRIAR